LKDYDYLILWLDYFNKNLPRAKGRRVKKEHAIFDPTLSDLVEAAKQSGYNLQQEQINDGARFPRRAFVKSGYVALPKKDNVKKNILLTTLAQRMLKNRTRWSKR
jgi:signal recognition particle subunit SRP19